MLSLVDRARLGLAVVLAVTYPPGVLYWYLLHPFAERWRRLGPRLSLTILLSLLLAGVLVGWRHRVVLVGEDLGGSFPRAVAGLLLAVFSATLEVRCRRLLRLPILSGVPELSADAPGRLLREGIYARMRHPRYVAVFASTWGWALIADYSGLYAVVAMCTVLLLGVVWLEEGELARRFGEEWKDYAASVPRFWPRRGSTGVGGDGGRGRAV